MTKLKVGGAALNQTPIHWSENLKNIEEAISRAKKESIDLLCLPELAITGYGCQDLFLSQWIPQKALDYLEKILPLCHDIAVVIGLPLQYNGLLYNTACFIDNGMIKGFYAKQHLANDGVHYEPRWFNAWPAGSEVTIDVFGQQIPLGDVIINYKGIRVGFEICEDSWRGQDRPAYNLYDRGVDIILNPSASHFAFGKTLLREELVLPASKSFNIAYIFANLLGNESGRMIFDGEIMIAQNGKMLRKNTRLSFNNVDLVATDIDFDNPENSISVPSEDTSDKRIEFSKSVSLALYDYFRKTGIHKAVISLSGGADSSTCAALIGETVRRGVRELGAEAFLNQIKIEFPLPHIHNYTSEDALCKAITNQFLITVYQASENSSNKTWDAARSLARSLGAQFYTWYIDEEVASYTKKISNVLERPLTWHQDDIAMQNIQSRARTPGIWMMANVQHAVLITTGNRSEGDVGYATMDGDTSGSLAPIAGVDKDFIRQWLQWTEINLDYPGLNKVNQLNPTAELRPVNQHQTDEDDLMPYPVLTAIERHAIGDWESPAEVYESLINQLDIDKTSLKAYITKFFKMWARNQWKRERTAPCFHLDDFNIDPKTWCRFPIISGNYEEELKELDLL